MILTYLSKDEDAQLKKIKLFTRIDFLRQL
jgi:hypothetical protein